jgi:hypothetical protein
MEVVRTSETSVFFNEAPSVVFELLILVRIREVHRPNLGQDTGYPEGGFRDFPLSFQANAGILPQIRS